MMRQGRKRIYTRERQPDGSVKTYDDPARETMVRRVRDAIWRDVKHEFHGYPLGIMYAMKIINDEEFVAAKKWTLLAHRVRTFEGINAPNCKAVVLGGGGRRLAPMPTEEEIAQYKRDRRRLLKLNARIVTSGPKAFGIMYRLCFRDEELVPREKLIAKRAMIALAVVMKVESNG